LEPLLESLNQRCPTLSPIAICDDKQILVYLEMLEFGMEFIKISALKNIKILLKKSHINRYFTIIFNLFLYYKPCESGEKMSCDCIEIFSQMWQQQCL